MTHKIIRNLFVCASLVAPACTGDDGSSSTSDSAGSGGTSAGSDSATSTSAGTAGGACPGIAPTASKAEGEGCTDNDECLSGVCLLFGDVPPPTDAVCGALPAGCATRITGTVRDFPTGAALSDVTVNFGKALDAAVNPGGFTPIVALTSDSEGKVDGMTPAMYQASLGIVGVASGPGFELTATGVVSPLDGDFYPPGVGIHEYWVAATDTLAAWSTELANDMAMAPFVPLGQEGGVVGIIRDETTGAPVDGATVEPANPGNSTALVRYLNDDGATFNDQASSTNGVFVLVSPSLAEEFVVMKGGNMISTENGTAGSASGAVFTMIMNVAP